MWSGPLFSLESHWFTSGESNVMTAIRSRQVLFACNDRWMVGFATGSTESGI